MSDIYFFHTICYARNGTQLYRVWPIYRDDALVTLYPIDDKGNGAGERIRVSKGDLLEEYKVYDKAMTEISPE